MVVDLILAIENITKLQLKLEYHLISNLKIQSFLLWYFPPTIPKQNWKIKLICLIDTIKMCLWIIKISTINTVNDIYWQLFYILYINSNSIYFIEINRETHRFYIDV